MSFNLVWNTPTEKRTNNITPQQTSCKIKRLILARKPAGVINK